MFQYNKNNKQPFKIPEMEIAEMQLGDETLAQCIQTAAKDTRPRIG